MNMKSDS